MHVFWIEPGWFVGMTLWLAVLIAGLRGLLRWRRLLKIRGNGGVPATLKAGLAAWFCLSTLTAFELGFALFVHQTDAFNMTTISKRWLRMHIDAERNQAGFRDRREFEKQVPPGVRRIVFFGDSFTAGHGVRNMADRFPDRIEQALNERQPGHWQVTNLGEPGYDVSLIEGLMSATFRKEKYAADECVYVCMLNDIEGYDPRTVPVIKTIQQAQPRFWLWTRTYFFNWLYFRWQQFRAGRTVDYFPHLAESYSTPAWEGMAQSIRQMQFTCRDSGVRLRIVVFPFLHDLKSPDRFQPAREKICRLGDELNVPVLDLYLLLMEHQNERLTVNRFDNHPNEACHQLVAEYLVEAWWPAGSRPQ